MNSLPAALLAKMQSMLSGQTPGTGPGSSQSIYSNDPTYTTRNASNFLSSAGVDITALPNTTGHAGTLIGPHTFYGANHAGIPSPTFIDNSNNVRNGTPASPTQVGVTDILIAKMNGTLTGITPAGIVPATLWAYGSSFPVVFSITNILYVGRITATHTLLVGGAGYQTVWTMSALPGYESWFSPTPTEGSGNGIFIIMPNNQLYHVGGLIDTTFNITSLPDYYDATQAVIAGIPTGDTITPLSLTGYTMTALAYTLDTAAMTNGAANSAPNAAYHLTTADTGDAIAQAVSGEITTTTGTQKGFAQSYFMANWVPGRPFDATAGVFIPLVTAEPNSGSTIIFGLGTFAGAAVNVNLQLLTSAADGADAGHVVFQITGPGGGFSAAATIALTRNQYNTFGFGVRANGVTYFSVGGVDVYTTSSIPLSITGGTGWAAITSKQLQVIIASEAADTALIKLNALSATQAAVVNAGGSVAAVLMALATLGDNAGA